MASSVSTELVQIKGTSAGLIITLPDGDLGAVLAQVDERLQAMASFIKGGRVAVAVGARRLTETDIVAIGHLLETHQVSLWALLSDQPATRQAAAGLGLAIERTPAPMALSTASSAPAMPAGSAPALVVHGDLGDGQRIGHAGAVVVIGDVNPGAQIVAGGDVVIWGSLHGIVHAGALGDEPAVGGEVGRRGYVVCALVLQPTQLRIGHALGGARQGSGQRWRLTLRQNKSVPEVAHVVDGAIVIEPWDQVKN